MNAIISGRNAVALLLDGDQLKSLHADAIDTLVPRKPADLPFLVGDANDLQFLENVTPEEIAAHLKRAQDDDEALQLLLILLDPELSEGVRQEAAEALEELLTDELFAAVVVRFSNLPAETLDNLLPGESVSHQYLRNVLYACPLPSSADTLGAIECCKQRSAVLVQNFLETLLKLQPIIHKVHLAWEAIPNATFGSDEMRVTWRAGLVRGGVFQDLVMKIAIGESVGKIQAPSLPKTMVKSLPEFEAVQRLWIEPLRQEFQAPERSTKQGSSKTTTESVKPSRRAIDTEVNLSPKIDSNWIVSRQDAVRFYLSKRWNLRGDDLDDVLQETLNTALKSFANYKGHSNVESGTLLIGIAKNVAQSYFRRLDRYERRCAPIEMAESIGLILNDETEAEKLAQLMREKLSELPEKYKQVLELIFYQDYREREAAEKLGIPVDRLYSIKSDALKRLRKLCLKDARFKP
jgi:RNA polymerase sigma factor (sigma-70 family)